MKTLKIKDQLLIILLITAVPSFAEDIFTNQFEQSIALRISEFEIVDPHMYTLIPIINICQDITDEINNQMQTSIDNDQNDDGFLDSNAIIQFTTDQPSYITSRVLEANYIGAECPDPLHSESCEIIAIQNKDTATLPNEASDCLAANVGTTSGYIPAPNTTTPPCYATAPIDSVINIVGLDVLVKNFQSSNRYQGGLLTDQGINKGFISEADAENIVFPLSVPVIGGQTLASILPGGLGNCANTDDRDIYIDNVTTGWWLYVNTKSEIIEVQ